MAGTYVFSAGIHDYNNGTYHQFVLNVEFPLQQFGCYWSAVDRVLPGSTEPAGVVCSIAY